jgi:hypothetical protein
MALIEAPHPLPFEYLQGKGSVPAIVFAIATHIMMPESDLLELLSCQKTLEEARQDADTAYGSEALQCDE